MLTGPKIIPKTPKNAVLFLHGFGSNGEDLIGLAPEIEPKLNKNLQGKTAYFSPNGIAPTEMGMGYQWFSDNNWTFRDRKGIEQAKNALWEYIKTEILTLGINPKNIIVIGFSQGTMQALFSAPRWEKSVAGVVGCSGATMWESELENTNFHTPPILLLHGLEDDVVPADKTVKSSTTLKNLGFKEVEHHLFPNLSHGINAEEIKLISKFINKILTP